MLITPSRIKRIKDLSIGPGVRKPRKKVLKGGKSLPTSTARERAIIKNSGMKKKQWKRQETIKPNVHPSKNDKMFLKQEKLLSVYKKSKAKSKSLKPTMKDVAGSKRRKK